MSITAKKAKEPIYCLDDLRKFLTPQEVIKLAPHIGLLLQNDQACYKVYTPGGTAIQAIYVTLEALDELLSHIGAPEAKAIKYAITHGVQVSSKARNEIVLCAKDVAICFGYANPGQAVQKYCKSAAGYIGKADVGALATHSKLENARQIRVWVMSIF